MKNDTDMTMRIAGIDPSTLHELREQFSDLEELAIVEPDVGSVTKDRELGTIILVITLTTAGINLATAILKFLDQRRK